MARHGEIRIGVSGWTYTPWRGNFYPTGLPQKRELAHCGTAFNSIEVNGSFHSLQRPTSDGNFVTAPEERPMPRDVYFYLDNTDKLHAPDNARGLMQRLSVSACAMAT